MLCTGHLQYLAWMMVICDVVLFNCRQGKDACVSMLQPKVDGIIQDPTDPDILVPYKKDLLEVQHLADQVSKKVRDNITYCRRSVRLQLLRPHLCA